MVPTRLVAVAAASNRQALTPQKPMPPENRKKPSWPGCVTVWPNGKGSMRLRGIFNPKIHIIIAVILITISVWTLFGLLSHANDVSFVRLDLRLIPVGLLLGLGVGVPVGIWRLHALHKALPDLDGQFYLSDADVLRQSLEGRNARTLQQIGFGLAVAIWFILLLHTGGQVILFGTTVFYILGQYLTGQFLPAIRLLIEIRRGDSSGPPRTS